MILHYEFANHCFYTLFYSVPAIVGLYYEPGTESVSVKYGIIRDFMNVYLHAAIGLC